jgi:hypothetical protein
MTYEDLKNEIRLDDITYDPWGTAMSWHFTLCDVLCWERNADIPQHWGFKSGISADDEDFNYDFLKQFKDEDLIKFGNLLSRYTAKLELAGKSY